MNATLATPNISLLLKELVVDVAQLKIPADSISDTANLFNDCGVDSTSIIDLVLAVEERFQITIDEQDLDVKLFQDLSNLTTYVGSQIEVV